MAYRPRHRKQSWLMRLLRRRRIPVTVEMRPPKRDVQVWPYTPRYGRQSLYYGDPAGNTRPDDVSDFWNGI